MAETPKNPIVLDSFDKKHLQQVAALENKVAAIYAELCKEVGVIAELYGKNVDLEKVFRLGDYPQLNKKVDEIIGSLHDRLGSAIVDGVTAQWQLANEKNDDLVRKVFGKDLDGLTEYQLTRYFTSNDNALKAFLNRKDKGLGLSQKVWKYAKEAKVDIESTLELGIKTGQSASALARDLKQHLKEPDRLFRRVRDKEGKLHLSKAAQAYHPGQGVYRSSYKNALRLAVTEANMAYRASDYERVQNFDFVVGIEVRLSNNHTLNGKPFYDICDELKGKYPKDFKFRGWHPFCYSKDSEVLTALGWKRFEDVTFEDKVVSLNPNTREVEYVSISATQKYWYAGPMYRFFNKTLDCLVTPDHQMVYLNKRDGEIRFCDAKDYTKGKGGFYRSAKNSAENRPHICIGSYYYNFDTFCEYMGYWLSDGSLEHNSGVSISQNVGEKAREDIIACIKKLGFEPKLRNDRVLFYDAGFNNYLKRFGYSYTKYIPQEIKNASARQIRIFLDAFIKCDGHERPCKSFVGSHGNVFTSQNGKKMYFTTSPQMAGDLCECMLKVGHRPSVAVSEPHTAIKKDGTIIQGNKPHYSIRECGSVTSTIFDKEIVPYSDYVYDLTLERNHIMYIKRNGKCFWGSNCRCHSITILKTREELMADNQRILDGQEPTEDSVNSVSDLPDNFKSWAVKNKSRILAADEKGTLPYFITDNPYSVNSAIGQPLASVKVPLWYAHNAQVKEVQGKLKEIKQWSYEHPKSKKIVGLINDTDAAISNGAAIEDILAKFESANKEYKGKLWEAEYVAKKKAEAAKKPTALEIAKKRHDARTQERIDKIRVEWGKRTIRQLNQAIDDGLLPQEVFGKTGDMYMMLKEGNFGAFNKAASPLQKAIARHKARTPEKIKAIKDAWNKRLEEIAKDEQFLSALIPDVKAWKKQFSSKKLHEVYDAVEKKMAQINALPLEQQVKALNKEILYVSDATYLKPHTLYPTWQVSQAAYYQQLGKVQYKISVSHVYDELEPINIWLKKHPKVKKLSGMVDEVENLINSGADISTINAKMSAINAEYKNKLYDEQYTAKLKAKKGGASATSSSGGIVQFDESCFTKARKDAALWDTEEKAKAGGYKHGKLADDALFDPATNAWKEAIKREDAAKKLINDYEKGLISKQKFEAELKAKNLRVYAYDSSGTIVYMTEREAIYDYTMQYCNVNEPLEGRRYIGSQKRDRFEAKTNAITNIIDTCETPVDMWFQRGDSGLDAIFGRLEFAGVDIPYSIRSKASQFTDELVADLQQFVGKTMQEGGFMSMGSGKRKGFTEDFGGKNVIMNIYAPKGTKAMYAEHFSYYGNGVSSANWDGHHAVIRNFSQEFETLAQRGTKMRITKIEKRNYRGNDIIYVDVEIVGQEIKDLSYVLDSNIGY